MASAISASRETAEREAESERNEDRETPGEGTGVAEHGGAKVFIHIKKADREAIMKAFGVSARMVSYAVYFDEQKGRTDLAKRIRKMAMERGGILKVTSPALETLHDSDGYIRQYLPGRVMIEIAKDRSQTADVYKDGVRVRHYDGVTLGSIAGIQQWAMTL